MMSRRESLGLTAVRSEGAILPPGILTRIHREDESLEGMKPADYGLAAGERLREAASRAWSALQAPWAVFQDRRAKLADGDTGTSLTRGVWLDRVFRALGYDDDVTVVRTAIRIGDHEFPVSHRFGHVPIHQVGCRLDLDRRTPGAVGAARMSPHGLVQLLLNVSDQHLYGFVTNGLRWRVLRDDRSMSRQSMVEFDLEAILDGQLYDEFLLFYLVCHRSRVQAPKPEETWLERWHETAGREGKRALDTLRTGVEKAITALGHGFLSRPANAALKERIRNGELDKQDYYRQLLRLVYRLLFLFVAEDRGVLLRPDATPAARAAFEKFYSTARLRLLAERLRGSRRHGDLYAQFRTVIRVLGEPDGCPALGLPALGGLLFGPEACPDLDAAGLSNADFLEALRHLAVTIEGGRRARVDYKNLGAEELGSVYESLLELRPDLTSDGSRFKLETVAGSERKSTGSYYTPDSLIQVLLDSALDPVVEEALKGKTGAAAGEAILSLRVVDPAVGSGHFLIAAAHRLARRLAQVRTGDEEPAPDATRHALRDVIGHCLYGVDINPMAAELCKVALWMEAMEPGKPLTFLDHHIRVGNSLLGATPELIAKGIPDDAFNPIEGDDRPACASLKRQNKAEREGQGSLFAPDVFVGRDLLEMVRRVEDADDGTLEDVRRKERAYRDAREGIRMRKLLADAWCAAFVQPKTPETLPEAITTRTLWALAGERKVPAGLEERVGAIAARYRFFHWSLEFPDVFADGGFDVVLGNPPWERIKLQEQEFFAALDEEIAKAPNAAARKALIAALPKTNPALAKAFEQAKREAEGASHFVRQSGRYPLTAVGDVNTYALFAELGRALAGPAGRTGIIVPTGIATDDTTKAFFGNLVRTGRLASLFDFENGGPDSVLFENVHRSFKLSLLTMRGGGRPGPVSLAFFLHTTAELQEPERRFELTPEDIQRLNPNTLTCPVFRTRADAALTADIYRRVPVLINEGAGENPWGIRFLAMFHMANDSGLFHTEPGPGRLPLYEAKMLHQFDHRWATYDNGDTRDVTDREKADPGFAVRPRYWVDADEVEARLEKRDRNGIVIWEWTRPWLLGWRDIARATDERTVVSTVLPRTGVGNKIPLALLDETDPGLSASLCACLASFPLDFAARQKVGGTTLNFFIVKQFPVVPPAAYTPDSVSFICKRVLELVYTANDTKPFAEDMGYDGPPFPWDPERRAVLRAELDALYARLYGLTRKQLRYILDPRGLSDRELEDILDPWEDPTCRGPHLLPERPSETFPGETFRVLKNREEKEYGEYRTRRLVLEAWERLQREGPWPEPYDQRKERRGDVETRRRGEEQGVVSRPVVATTPKPVPAPPPAPPAAGREEPAPDLVLTSPPEAPLTPAGALGLKRGDRVRVGLKGGETGPAVVEEVTAAGDKAKVKMVFGEGGVKTFAIPPAKVWRG
jgi:hypothetical protein